MNLYHKNGDDQFVSYNRIWLFISDFPAKKTFLVDEETNQNNNTFLGRIFDPVFFNSQTTKTNAKISKTQ